MFKIRKVSICSWALVGFIGNLNAQYIHSFDSFQNKYSERSKAYLLNTDQFNFSSGIDSINDLIESGLSRQNEGSFDSLQKATVSSFQNAFPKEDDFDQKADFRLSSSDLLTSSSGFESIDKITADIYDFNLSQSFPWERMLDQINLLLEELSSGDVNCSGFSNFKNSQTINSDTNLNLDFYQYLRSSFDLGILTNRSNETSKLKSPIDDSNKVNGTKPITFGRNSLFYEYPKFSKIYRDKTEYNFNAFASVPFEVVNDDIQEFEHSRQRRKSYSGKFDPDEIYDLEITDFSGGEFAPVEFTETNATIDDDTNESMLTSSSPMKLRLVNGGSGMLSGTSIFGYEFGVGGANWTDSAITFNSNTSRFLTVTNDTSYTYSNDHFVLVGDHGIDAWLGGAYNSWVWNKSGGSITYTFDNSALSSRITLSVVPEPSTYFMTGALFCLLGCNRQTRRSFKLLFAKLFYKLKLKVSCSSIHKRLS